MKILVITPTFIPIIGGAEIGIYEIYRRIGKNHHVRILTREHPKYVIDRQGSSDVYFKDVNFDVKRFKDYFKFRTIKMPKLFYEFIRSISIFYMIAVIKNIIKFRPDIINFHFVITNGPIILLINKLIKIPIILSLVGTRDVIEKESSVIRRIYMLNI